MRLPTTECGLNLKIWGRTGAETIVLRFGLHPRAQRGGCSWLSFRHGWERFLVTLLTNVGYMQGHDT